MCASLALCFGSLQHPQLRGVVPYPGYHFGSPRVNRFLAMSPSFPNFSTYPLRCSHSFPLFPVPLCRRGPHLLYNLCLPAILPGAVIWRPDSGPRASGASFPVTRSAPISNHPLLTPLLTLPLLLRTTCLRRKTLELQDTWDAKSDKAAGWIWLMLDQDQKTLVDGCKDDPVPCGPLWSRLIVRRRLGAVSMRTMTCSPSGRTTTSPSSPSSTEWMSP
jgi:hypothetical protein